MEQVTAQSNPPGLYALSLKTPGICDRVETNQVARLAYPIALLHITDIILLGIWFSGRFMFGYESSAVSESDRMTFKLVAAGD